MRWHFLITRSLWTLSRMCFRTISLRGARYHRLSSFSCTHDESYQGTDAPCEEKSPLFELARVLVRLDHVSSRINLSCSSAEAVTIASALSRAVRPPNPALTMPPI